MHLVETTCSGATAEEDFLVRQKDLSLSRRNIYQFRFLSKKTRPTIWLSIMSHQTLTFQTVGWSISLNQWWLIRA